METLKLFLIFSIQGLAFAIGGALVLFMMALRIPPVIFLPGVLLIFLAFQTYGYAMYLSAKERKLTRFGLFTIGLISMFAVPYTAYAIVTPNWSFTVTTDKPVYVRGENVTITATLTNNGYITHSFSSSYKNPIVITVGRAYQYSIWWLDADMEIINKTTFSVAAGQSMQRTIIWNQTRWEFRRGDDIMVPIWYTGNYTIRASVRGVQIWQELCESYIQITIIE